MACPLQRPFSTTGSSPLPCLLDEGTLPKTHIDSENGTLKNGFPLAAPVVFVFSGVIKWFCVESYFSVVVGVNLHRAGG